jgi:predicted amidohydrolase
MPHDLHLAVAQAPSELDGVAARLSWLSDQLPDIAAQGVDLLLLPELFACGYHIGADVITRAEPQDGETAQKIRHLAMTYGVAVHYGYSEAAGGAIFNAAQCFGPDGTRLGGHRKLAIPPGFERDYFTPGAGCNLFTFAGIRIGTLICYDAEFPETARHLAAMGAELILVPTALGANWDWVAQTMIPTRAFENGVFLAYANSAGCERGLTYLGQSCIAGPNGQILSRAGSAPEIISARITTRAVAQAQARLPYLQDRKTLNFQSS